MSIYITLDKGIEQELWEKYPIVSYFCQELKNVKYQADLSINYKGIFNRYDNVDITVFEKITIFKIYKDSYTFDFKTIVINHKDIETYEITHW